MPVDEQADKGRRALANLLMNHRELMASSEGRFYVSGHSRSIEVVISPEKIVDSWDELASAAEGLGTDIEDSVAKLLGIYLFEARGTMPAATRALSFDGSSFRPDAVGGLDVDAVTPGGRVVEGWFAPLRDGTDIDSST